MKFKTKTAIAVTAVMLMLTAFSFSVLANVPQNAEATQETTQTAEELSVNDNAQSKAPLTPEGNLTKVDDVHQTTEKNDVEDKQFITVESKNGNTFYIIVDRSGDTENVYFLNAVDESDLLALMEDEKKAEVTAVCTCTDKCELGGVNENCPVCSKNIQKCNGTETVTEEKDKTDDKPETTSSNPALILIVLMLLGGGGAFYWFKIKNKKPSTKGDTEPEEYEDDDYEEESEEVVETEVADDTDNSDDENEDTDESEDDEE